MKLTYGILAFLSLSCFLFLSGSAFGAENESLLGSFAEDISQDPQLFIIVLLFLAAIAVYIYYIWRDYRKDDDFLSKKR